MFYKKIVLTFCIFLIGFTKKVFSQTSLPDTAYSRSFSFLDDSGNPMGTILYQEKMFNTMYVIFQYNDGRKFKGWMIANQPQPTPYAVVYYPDGTIFIGGAASGKNTILRPEENLVAISNVTAGIHYPDGTHFIGNVNKYSSRNGFQFAPDGSYMLSTFFYKQPHGYLTYKTIHYAGNHNFLSEGYHIGADDEMDFETFKQKYKKEKPGFSSDVAKKLKFRDYHYRDKTCEYTRFETKKNDEGFGFFENKNTCKDGNGWVISGSYFGGEQEYYVKYLGVGDTALIKIPGTGYLMQPNEAPYNGLYTSRLKRGDGMQFRATDWQYKYDDYLSSVMCYADNNGAYYLGTEDGNKFNGYGINKISGYGTYYGEYINGKRSSNGTIRYVDGSYYKGSWQNDERNGPGRSYNAAGQLIEQGIYTNGKLVTPQKKVDLGYYEFIDEFPVAKPKEPYYVTTEVKNKQLDGAIYTGSTLIGNPEGYGILTFANGITWTGNWHQGQPKGVMTIQYMPTLENGKTLPGGIYVGEIKNNKYEGMGRIMNRGIEQIGTFHNGKLNGSCVVWQADGTGQMGFFENGLMEGRIQNVKRDLSFNFGYATYLHHAAEGEANTYLGDGQYSKGNYHNNKLEGVWTNYITEYGKERIIGTIIYKDGVEISRTIK